MAHVLGLQKFRGNCYATKTKEFHPLGKEGVNAYLTVQTREDFYGNLGL
jgi:hypothetical protein